MTDKKDILIAILRQQRDELNNRIAEVMVEANSKITEMQAEIDRLNSKHGNNINDPSKELPSRPPNVS